MSSDFDAAFQQAQSLRTSKSRAYDEAVEAALRNKQIARSIADPVLRELGPKVAQKLKDLAVPLNESPPSSTPVRYWDFKPHLVVLSEDGHFMRPYSREDDIPLQRKVAPNSGLDAAKEFEAYLDQIELFASSKCMSCLPSGPGALYSYPETVLASSSHGVAIVDHSRNVLIAFGWNDDGFIFESFDVARFMAFVVVSMQEYGDAGKAKDLAREAGVGRE